METQRQIKIIAVAVVVSVLFVLFEQAYGAGTTANTNNNSERRGKRTSTPVSRPPTKITSPSSFTPDMPFSDAIDILRNSTKPPLSIAVLWRDLEENANVYPETPIRMNGLSRVPLRTHLKVLLMSVSGNGGERLGYVVRGGVIIIATQSSLPKRRVARVYDISDLVAPPANYRFGIPFGFGGGGLGFGGQGFGGTPFGGQGYGSPFGGQGYGGYGAGNIGGLPLGGGFNTIGSGYGGYGAGYGR